MPILCPLIPNDSPPKDSQPPPAEYIITFKYTKGQGVGSYKPILYKVYITQLEIKFISQVKHFSPAPCIPRMGLAVNISCFLRR